MNVRNTRALNRWIKHSTVRHSYDTNGLVFVHQIAKLPNATLNRPITKTTVTSPTQHSKRSVSTTQGWLEWKTARLMEKKRYICKHGKTQKQHQQQSERKSNRQPTDCCCFMETIPPGRHHIRETSKITTPPKTY